MKIVPHFFVIFFLATGIDALAQITITSADMPLIGDAYIRATDNLPSVTPGNAGANQVWNFSALIASQIDSQQFVNPISTPLAADFSAATIAEKLSYGNGGYTYERLSPNSFDFLGLVSYPSLNEIVFIPPIVSLPIPCSYQSQWSGSSDYSTSYFSSIYSGYDSINVKTHQLYHDSIDAWGIITTPLGMFNSLRDFETTTKFDSIWRHSIATQSWDFYSTSVNIYNSFVWRTNSIHAKLVRMYVDTLGNPTSVIWIQSIIPTGIQVQVKSSLNLFPNPANDEICFQSFAASMKKIKISDVLGNEMKTVEISAEVERISTNEFANGVYFYELIGEQSEILASGKFVIMK